MVTYAAVTPDAPEESGFAGAEAGGSSSWTPGPDVSVTSGAGSLSGLSPVLIVVAAAAIAFVVFGGDL